MTRNADGSKHGFWTWPPLPHRLLMGSTAHCDRSPCHVQPGWPCSLEVPERTRNEAQLKCSEGQDIDPGTEGRGQRQRALPLPHGSLRGDTLSLVPPPTALTGGNIVDGRSIYIATPSVARPYRARHQYLGLICGRHIYRHLSYTLNLAHQLRMCLGPPPRGRCDLSLSLLLPSTWPAAVGTHVASVAPLCHRVALPTLPPASNAAIYSSSGRAESISCY